jgi:hypothetical protein
MKNHSRSLGFDNLEGRQLLSVAPAPAVHPPIPRNVLLADIQYDLGNLAKEQIIAKRDTAKVTTVTNELALDNRELTLAQTRFAADETALLANLQQPVTKSVLEAREVDLAAVAADNKEINGLQKDIATDTTDLAVDKIKLTQDQAIVSAILADITADIKAL